MDSILFSFSDIIIIASLALETGIVLQRLKILEKKQDKYNNVLERLATVENSVKSAHHRIDSIK